MNPIVLLLFFFSGATALIYEVIWSKYLALMFGSTVQAQTVVLAVFMGGLALGNRLFGKKSATLKQPLAAYGYIELAIGLYAFFFPMIHKGADKIFVTVGSGFAESPFPLLLFKGALAVGLLLIPTVLMGGTLPLLAAWLERRMNDAGRGSARFYSTNSLGAVFGSGVAGFYLVRQWGMSAGLQWAAFANLLVALCAIAISRSQGDDAARPEKSTGGNAALPAKTAVILVTITGGVSMGLEVLCSRAVAMVVGGSLQAFAIVLMAFILGIGIGAGIVASPRFARWHGQKTIFALMLGAAAVIGIFIFGVEEWVLVYSRVRYGLALNETGYFAHQFIVGMVAICTLGIPAGLLGAVLPLAIRTGSATGGSLGDQVGRLLTWNTLGAVIGVLLTGFVLMPYAGLRESFLILGAALALIAAVGAGRVGASRLGWASYALLGCMLLMFAAGNKSWQSVVGGGFYRLRGMRLTHSSLEARRTAVKVHFYKDAPDATVAVEESSNLEEGSQLLLRINGKTDASTRGDLPTQYLLGHLPVFARPESKEVFVLGFGSGITAGAVLGHPIEGLTIAENCGPVLEAATFFDKWNRGVLRDPRVRVRREDARTVLKLSEKKYDVIINEPSNPWVVGVGSVFSREFYELCASRLTDGGINAQWFHVYEMHDGIAELVIRTFASVYPYVEIWEPLNGDLILLGSMKPWESTPEEFEKSLRRERPRQDIEELGFKTAAAIFTRQLASQQTAFALAGDGPTQSDEFPVLEYSAPEAFYIGQNATRLFAFDERTRQCTLAPAWKRQALQDLPEGTLRTGISEPWTGNAELIRYLNWRQGRHFTSATHPVYDLDTALPIIFRPPPSYVLTPKANASEVEARLLKAENEILLDSPKALEAIRAIESALETEPKEAKRTWKPAHFAVAAARSGIAKNQFERAPKLIELGLKFDPNNVELPYLQRILEARRGK